MRDRVVVSIVADVDRLVGVDACDQISFKRMGRKREQSGLLFGEDLADRAGIIIGPGAAVRRRVAPLQRLAIEVLESGKAASGEEGIANIADGPFDPPFLIATAGLARESGEMIVAAQVEKPGMKTDRIAKALQDD